MVSEQLYEIEQRQVSHRRCWKKRESIWVKIGEKNIWVLNVQIENYPLMQAQICVK